MEGENGYSTDLKLAFHLDGKIGGKPHEIK